MGDELLAPGSVIWECEKSFRAAILPRANSPFGNPAGITMQRRKPLWRSISSRLTYHDVRRGNADETYHPEVTLPITQAMTGTARSSIPVPPLESPISSSAYILAAGSRAINLPVESRNP